MVSPVEPVSGHCTYCGAETLEAGFLEDGGESSRGFIRWVRGRLEIGLLGARRLGRTRVNVHTARCRQCGHLELFAME